MLNEYYQNIGMKGFIKRYGIANAIKRGLYMANPIHFVKDYEIKKVLWQKKALKKVEKYVKYANVEPEGIQYSEKKVCEPIWIYWNSGMDSAPAIIKKCYESVCKYGNREIILLTENNMTEYIQLPNYIEEKKNRGEISLAAYADLMRFSLLAHYGGIWIDATVYLTGAIPKEIEQSDFWVFQNTLGLIENPVLYPAWFIRAKKNNQIITQIRNVAFAYWEDNKYVLEYLLPNLIFKLILDQNPDVKKEMFYLNSDYSEYLIKVLGEKYTQEKFDWIEKLTSIHKITYKLNPSINKEGTIYRYILEEK